MSGPLVPTNGGVNNFSQQGQLDWVALSSSTVGISIAALQRLSKAGVDPYTVQIGKALCWGIDLAPRVQKEMNEEIAKLKSNGIFGDMIWIGFGVKQTIRELAETEEGLCFITLCSTLLTAFDEDFSAHVLRELCSLRQVPRSATPSLAQWRSLIVLCGSGILLGSQFERILLGFCRLISGPITAASKQQSDPPNIANVLWKLIEVQNSNLHALTVAGNADFGWLAAFAQHVLQLDIAVVGKIGSQIYRSSVTKHNTPQTTFELTENEGSIPQSIQETHLVRMPHKLVHFNRDAGNDTLAFSRLRSTWSTILRDAFGPCTDFWLRGEGSSELATLLSDYRTMRLDDPSAMRESKLPASRFPGLLDFCKSLLILRREASSNHVDGQRFVDFASKLLPELADPLQKYPPKACSGSFQSFNANLTTLIVRHESGASEACRRQLRPKHRYCFIKVIFGILALVTFASDSDLDDEISPSASGLMHFSDDLVYHYIKSRKATCDVMTQLNWVKMVFTNEKPNNQLIFDVSRQDFLAVVSQGLCFYYQGIENPLSSASEVCRLRVVRGHINFDGEFFMGISDRAGASHKWAKALLSNPILRGASKAQMLVQPPLRGDTLMIGYRLSSTDAELEREREVKLGWSIRQILDTKLAAKELLGGGLELIECKNGPDFVHLKGMAFRVTELNLLQSFLKPWHDQESTMIITGFLGQPMNQFHHQALCILYEDAMYQICDTSTFVQFRRSEPLEHVSRLLLLEWYERLWSEPTSEIPHSIEFVDATGRGVRSCLTHRDFHHD